MSKMQSNLMMCAQLPMRNGPMWDIQPMPRLQDVPIIIMCHTVIPVTCSQTRVSLYYELVLVGIYCIGMQRNSLRGTMPGHPDQNQLRKKSFPELVVLGIEPETSSLFLQCSVYSANC